MPSVQNVSLTRVASAKISASVINYHLNQSFRFGHSNMKLLSALAATAVTFFQSLGVHAVPLLLMFFSGQTISRAMAIGNTQSLSAPIRVVFSYSGRGFTTFATPVLQKVARAAQSFKPLIIIPTNFRLTSIKTKITLFLIQESVSVSRYFSRIRFAAIHIIMGSPGKGLSKTVGFDISGVFTTIQGIANKNLNMVSSVVISLTRRFPHGITTVTRTVLSFGHITQKLISPVVVIYATFFKTLFVRAYLKSWSAFTSLHMLFRRRHLSLSFMEKTSLIKSSYRQVALRTLESVKAFKVISKTFVPLVYVLESIASRTGRVQLFRSPELLSITRLPNKLIQIKTLEKLRRLFGIVANVRSPIVQHLSKVPLKYFRIGLSETVSRVVSVSKSHLVSPRLFQKIFTIRNSSKWLIFKFRERLFLKKVTTPAGTQFASGQVVHLYKRLPHVMKFIVYNLSDQIMTFTKSLRVLLREKISITRTVGRGLKIISIPEVFHIMRGVADLTPSFVVNVRTQAYSYFGKGLYFSTSMIIVTYRKLRTLVQRAVALLLGT